MAKYISNRQRNLKIGIVSYTENKTVLEVTGKVGIGTTNATSKLWVDGDGYFVGVLTASQLSTGASGTGINISTSTISGPATLTIDPAADGDNTGAVRIKGDLYVDGTQFIVNSTTIELADFNVGIATTVGTNVDLNGAGIGIGSTGIRKTLTWNNNSTALKSSEDFTLASGKVYKIDGTDVLSSTTLGLGVTNSSLTSVGTLTNLSVNNVTGVSTLGVTSTTNLTSQTLNVSGISTLGVTSTTNLTSQTLNVSGISTLGVTSTTDLTSQTLNVSGISTLGVTSTTNLTSQTLNVSGISTLGVTSTTNLTSQTLNVSGISTLGDLTSQTLNVSGVVTATSYNVGTAAGISTTITTVATTAATTIDSFDVATFRSAKLQIQITQSTNYQRSDILVIHDGTTASFVEYGSIATNDYLGTFSATISGANVVTQVAMISATSSTVKVLSQKITV